LEFSLLMQVMVNTAMLTGVYVLIAVGLNLIFGILKIIQFAHGQLYMMGAFMVYILVTGLGLNFYLALPVAALIVGLASLVIERFFYRPLKGDVLPSLLMGVALLVGLEGSFQLIFGAQEKYIENPLPKVVKLFGVSVPEARLLILVVAIASTIAVYLFLRRTKMGQAMRALTQDPEAASLQGINVNQIRAIGFAIASALAGVAGGLMLPIAYVTPFIGSPMVIKAFLIVILGGMGSLPGAVLGAFILAAADSFGFTFWGPVAALIGYLLVIVMLILRPRGLFGASY